MTDVKRVFFFENEGEAKKVREETGDRYILTNIPLYELTYERIVYTCGGYSDYATDMVVRPAVSGAKTGYGE